MKRPYGTGVCVYGRMCVCVCVWTICLPDYSPSFPHISLIHNYFQLPALFESVCVCGMLCKMGPKGSIVSLVVRRLTVWALVSESVIARALAAAGDRGPRRRAANKLSTTAAVTFRETRSWRRGTEITFPGSHVEAISQSLRSGEVTAAQ